MKSINVDVKVFGKAIAPFAIAVILFLWLLKFGFGKVSDLRLRISDIERNILSLEQKQALLQEVDQDTLSKSNISVIALPAENPALLTLSQLRLLGSERSIILTNLKTSSEMQDKSGLKKVEISFDIEAPRELILDFLSSVGSVAPISVIEKVKINEAAGVSRASVVIKSFWSELPESLPPITETMNSLTEEEFSVLGRVSFLREPVFTTGMTPSAVTSTRDNPFSF